jgi:uncharacterized protein YcgL (UPF0745 family)
MYLYVDIAEALTRVPQSLLDKFGKPVEVLSLELTAGKKLARADAETVLDEIESAGYYLQMPPLDEKVCK